MHLLKKQRDFIASMLLSVKRDLLYQILWKLLKITTLWDTPLSLLPPPQKQHLFNSWLLIQVALLENSSEITANTLSLSMMIYQSKPLLTDKCLFFLEDLLEEKLTQVMSFISTLVFSKEQLKWTWNTVVDPLLPSQLLKPKLVMSQPISQQTLSQLLMDKSSWKLNFSIRVSDQPLTSVFLCPESDQLPKSRPWNKSPVLWNLNWPNTEKSLPSPNSVQISMLLLNIFLTEVKNLLNYWNKNNTYQWLLKNKYVSFMLVSEDS